MKILYNCNPCHKAQTRSGNAAQDAPREAFAAGRGKASNEKRILCQNSSIGSFYSLNS
ncbi:MAG: hypothetical protein J6M62_09545 [Selenomonadaceae bacterium]|nr:hypothetical protein [Selenomonadaceae bacterium]